MNSLWLLGTFLFLCKEQILIYGFEIVSSTPQSTDSSQDYCKILFENQRKLYPVFVQNYQKPLEQQVNLLHEALIDNKRQLEKVVKLATELERKQEQIEQQNQQSQKQMKFLNEQRRQTSSDLEQTQLAAISDVKLLLDKKLERIDKLEQVIDNQTQFFSSFTKRLGTKLQTYDKERNCYEILKNGNYATGVYTIKPSDTAPDFKVLCNMDTHEGGWTYVLNRFDGSQDFFLKYEDYRKGFGNLSGEFWLGLTHMYELTGSKDNELLVELVKWNGNKGYAFYEKFRLGSEHEGYSLKVLGGYIGSAGDSLTYHKNSRFTTKDHRQDQNSGKCVDQYEGAWWYNSCYDSHLTGIYTRRASDKGMNWWKFDNTTLKEARMLVRPSNR